MAEDIFAEIRSLEGTAAQAPKAPESAPEEPSSIPLLDTLKGIGRGYQVGRKFLDTAVDRMLIDPAKSAYALSKWYQDARSQAVNDPMSIDPLKFIKDSVQHITPGNAAKVAGSMTIGPTLTEAISQGSLDPIKNDPYNAAVDAVTAPLNALPLLTAGVKTGSVLRKISPTAEKIGKRTDKLVSKVVPRYNYTDEALAIEGRYHGNVAHGTVTDIQPGSVLAASTNPADVTRAEIMIATNEGELLRRGLKGPVSGPTMLTKTVPAERGVEAARILENQVRTLALDDMLEDLSAARSFGGQALVTHGTAPGPDYVPLPKYLQNAKWKSKTTWVHKDVEDAVASLAPGLFTNPIQRYLQAWKALKVVANPPTHLNNMTGNVLYSVMLGESMLNPAKMDGYRKAAAQLAEFHKAGKTFTPTTALLEQAMLEGVVVPGFARAEFGPLYSHLSTTKTKYPWDAYLDAISGHGEGALADLARGATTLYDFEDQWFKLGAWINKVERGVPVPQATLEVLKGTPSYGATSQVGRFARGQNAHGLGQTVMSPFTSFPLEASRIFITAAKEHPIRAAVAQSIPLMMAMTGMVSSGMDPDEYWETVHNASSYHQGRLLLPVSKDSWIDLTNVMPLADLLTTEGRWNSVLSGPIWDLIDVTRNVDRRTGQPIHGPETDLRDKARWGAKFALPPFVPRLIEGLQAADEERPTRRFGEDMTAGKAIRETMAPMTRTYSTDELEQQGQVAKKAELGKLKGRRRSIQRNPAVGEDTKERYMENIFDEIRRLRETR